MYTPNLYHILVHLLNCRTYTYFKLTSRELSRPVDVSNGNTSTVTRQF